MNFNKRLLCACILVLGAVMVVNATAAVSTANRPETPLAYNLERISYSGVSDLDLKDMVYCTASASHSGVACYQMNGSLCADMHNTPVPRKSVLDVFFFKITAGDGSRHDLPDYQPLYVSPIKSLTNDLTRHELWHYQQTPPEDRLSAVCLYCDSKTVYVADIFHDVAFCNHAVFSSGDYCKHCDRYQATDYYDICGCYLVQ